ncbi:DNA mismatch repair protein MutS [Methanocorpusculaceae archaeon Sp1]|nr:DNA mismatch repair protein MutS [Methanocorpusculaceae archaeon Sp1]
MVPPKKLTPAMEQVRTFKEQYPDCVLFMRMGDFYETFWEDAEICARELDIVQTTRSKDPDGNQIPLAGIPYHALDLYLPRMIRKGYKVAICEQVEDPKTAKGCVKRDVIRVVTPGTAIDTGIVDGSAAHYLMALSVDAKKKSCGLAFLDITTGEFFVKDIASEENHASLATEIERYTPAEILVPQGVSSDLISFLAGTGRVLTPGRSGLFADGETVLSEAFGVATLEGFDCADSLLCISAAGAALRYAKETQKTALPHISGFSRRHANNAMVLDAITLRNLEILSPLRGDRNDTTLFGFLNRTKTPMGSRTLRSVVTVPLMDPAAINRRLDAVEFFNNRPVLCGTLGTVLAKVADIERIAGRIAYGNASPRDLLSLASTVARLPEIGESVGETSGLLAEQIAKIPDFTGVADLINAAIIDDPPAVYRNGNVIRAGYNADLDELHDVLANGRGWIAELQQTERDRTGIKSLKIAYNNIFGYYIEVTKANLDKVPPEYERKQTTVNGERFTLPALREREALMAQADSRILALEVVLYESLIETLRSYVPAFKETAEAVGTIDMIASFAELASANRYVRPEFSKGEDLLIRDGRHPIVENSVPGGYVPNDTEMNASGDQILILTGANMAGKSTYMRSVALICIMAQIGSFVPARYAKVGIVDRIFTRVGASDDLAGGQSTFMVEMLELANILNNATDKSLILLDEIGRGTSTVDGYAIARAVLEYLHGKGAAGPRTLFATHFHQLIGMEQELRRVRNYHFAVKEDQYDITFLRKLIPGATDRSYGIHVARIAGVPKKVLTRAEAVLDQALREDAGSGGKKYYTQMLLVDTASESLTPAVSAVEERVREANLNEMTPMQALMFVNELKSMMERK